MSQVSIYKDFNKIEDISLERIIIDIKGGKYKDSIKSIRKLIKEGKNHKAKDLKKHLLAFTPSGVFKSNRTAKSISEYSGFVILDIDKLSIEELKRIIPIIHLAIYTYAAFISPSGNGIKIIVPVNTSKEHYKEAYKQVVDYYEQALNIEIDNSGSDISRLCFMSYDPECFFNKEAESYEVFIEEKPLKIVPSKPLFSISINDSKIEKYINEIEKTATDITGNYETWRNLGFAISEEYGESGREYYYRISRFHPNYNHQECDKQFSNCLKAKGTGINISTFYYYAKQSGIVIVNEKEIHQKSSTNKLNKNRFKIQNSVFISKSANQLIEDAKKEPMPNKLVGELIYENEQTILFASTNLGKSILATQIAIAVSSGESFDLGNGLILDNEVGSVTTLFFDFELSDRQFLKRIGNATLPDNFYISKIERGKVLTGKPKQIFNLLKSEAESVDAKFIIVDNISKIGNKLEESENAIEFMGALWDLARHENYSILIIAHTPKRNRVDPITSDSISGSSKIGQLSDSIIGINEFTSQKEGQVYIKQIKTRNDVVKYGKSNVICTNITTNSEGLVIHEMFALTSELNALHGNRGANTDNLNQKMYATASHLYYGTYINASIETGIPKSTLNQRVKSLNTMHQKEWKRINKMDKPELINAMKLYGDEERDYDQVEIGFPKTSEQL